MTDRSLLAQLVEKWRAEGAQCDTFHATLGLGFKKCADELAAALSRLGGPQQPAFPKTPCCKSPEWEQVWRCQRCGSLGPSVMRHFEAQYACGTKATGSDPLPAVCPEHGENCGRREP